MNRPLVPEDIRQVSAAAVLGWVARAQAVARKSYADAARDFLTANHAPLLAHRIYSKAAIGGGSTADSTLGTEGISIGAWSDSARASSAFYRILADGAFARVPFKTRVGMVTSAPSAGVVAEGKSIPVSKVTLNNLLLDPIKVNALIVVTDTLLLATDPGGQSLFNRELLSVISAAVDTAFVDKLDNGLTPITSTGPTADLRAALAAVTSVAVPRLYWIASPDVARWASTLPSTKTGSAFAAASATGGELANLPMLVSSGVASGSLYLLDAAQVAANGEAPTISASSAATVQMDTAPTMASDVPTAAQTVSMFQTNSTALKSTAIIACEKLRSTAVAVINNISTTTWSAT